jgi:hypothetical protein
MTAPQHPQNPPQPTNGHDSRADVAAAPPRLRGIPHSRVGEVWVAAVLFAVFGILLVTLPGTARIVQLRILNRRRAAAGSGDRP